MKKNLNIAKLYDVHTVGIKDVAMRIIMTLSKERPEAVVAGLATLFILICKRYGVEVRAVLDVTDRVLRDAADTHPVEIRALKRYLKQELNDA